MTRTMRVFGALAVIAVAVGSAVGVAGAASAAASTSGKPLTVMQIGASPTFGLDFSLGAARQIGCDGLCRVTVRRAGYE